MPPKIGWLSVENEPIGAHLSGPLGPEATLLELAYEQANWGA